jgi:uncharacterized protein (DUF433 family)
MDNNFDRIIREPLVMGGQARIRDTNITVNEIVRLSLEGVLQADILRKHPELDAEDVHQTLAYWINTLEEKGRTFSTSLLNPLLTLAVSIELVKEDIADNAVNKSILTETLTDAQKATNRLRNLISWSQQFHGIILMQNVDNNRQQLPKQLINQATNKPSTVPAINIRSLPYLEQAIQVLRTKSDRLLGNEVEFNIVVDTYQINFQIVRESYENVIEKIDWLFQAYSEFDFANLWLYENGSELAVRQDEDKVIFEFSLPIWKDEQD